MTEKRKLVENWFQQVWNERRVETVDQLVSPDFRMHGLAPQPLGITEFKAFHRFLCEQVPDLKIELTHFMEEGDWVVMRARVTGAHRESATPISFEGGGFGRIADGRLVETRETWDLLSYLVQTGVVPGAEVAAGLGMAG